MAKAKSVIDTILGEAASGTRAQRFQDMLGIASVIANRAAMTGKTLQQVVSAPRQFDAYGKALPKGVEAHRALAERALQQVLISGPIHNATYYATPAAAKNLPKGLQQIDQTTGHVYFSDPQNRAIRTSVGYVTPVANAISQVADTAINAIDTVTAPARNVAANVANSAAAMRTAAFSPVASIPSVPSSPRGLEALAPNGLIGTGPLASYSRANLTPGVAGVLDALATNPAAANVSVNSGYRDPARNAAVGGARRSQHTLGNAVDLNVSGLSDQQKASLLDTAIEAGAKGIGLYSSGNAVHVDSRASPAVWSDSHAGIPVSAAPSWAQPALQDLMNAGPFAVTPRSSPPTPSMRPEVPTALAAAPVEPVERAPLGPVQSAFAAPQRPSTPTPAAALASMSNPAPVPSAGLGLMSSAQAAPMPSVPSMPSRPVTPTPAAALAAMTAPQAPSVPSSLMSPTALGVPQTLAPPNSVMPTFVPAMPNVPPVAPVAPPTVPTQPKTPDMRVAEAHAASSFPTAPRATAMDVYNGLATQGVANNGNVVSRDQFGNTSVTNQYGVTTTTNPRGMQSTSRGVPSVPSPGIAGPLDNQGIQTQPSGGMFGIQPAKTETGNIARGVVGSMAGSAIGSAAGPIGSIIGAAIGRSIAQGRNPLDAITGNRSGMMSFNSPVFGRINAYAPQTGGAFGTFPGAPTGVKGALGGKQSNRDGKSMAGISPGAAAAIGKGQGGLY